MKRHWDSWTFCITIVLSLALHVGVLKGLAHAAFAVLAPRPVPKKTFEMAIVLPPPASSLGAAAGGTQKMPARSRAAKTRSPANVPPQHIPPQPVKSVQTQPVDLIPSEPPPRVFRVAMSAVATVGDRSGSESPIETGSAGGAALTSSGTGSEGDASAGDGTGSGQGVALVPVHRLDSMPIRRGVCVATYPLEARQLGIEGLVRLHVDVLPDGHVGHVTVLEGLGHGLDQAAIAAIKKCQFEPAILGSEAVATRITYDYRFTLND